MTRSHQALILGSDPAGKLEGIVVLQTAGTAGRFGAAVARTCADMKRRGLKVTVRLNGRPSRGGGKKQGQPHVSSKLH